MTISVTINGIEKAVNFLNITADQLREAGRTVVMVGSSLPYARFIETGLRRGKYGTIRRRAGPARMLERSLREDGPRLKQEVGIAIRDGRPVRPVLLAAGHRVQRRAQSYTPVVTGTLRQSLHTVEGHR